MTVVIEPRLVDSEECGLDECVSTFSLYKYEQNQSTYHRQCLPHLGQTYLVLGIDAPQALQLMVSAISFESPFKMRTASLQPTEDQLTIAIAIAARIRV